MIFVRCGISALVSLFAFATRAHAFFDSPWITPETPRAGGAVSANFRMGDCDARVEEPGFPQIARSGNAIRLVVYGVHADTAELCIYPAAAGTELIGWFGPGDYVLTVDFLYDDYLFGPTILNMGVVPFTVTGAVATPASALNCAGTLALFSIIGSVALLRLRHRLTPDGKRAPSNLRPHRSNDRTRLPK